MNRVLTYSIACVLVVIAFTLSAQNPTNPYKAPLYWDVYENNFLKEKAGVTDNYISESEWLSNINWVDANLKTLGYKTICIDGWGNVDYNQYGYRTKHSSNWLHDYAWWAAELQKRGMNLGIYDNPLWVNPNAAAAGVKVVGTNILLSSLINTSENAKWFTWLQVDRPGAQEYVKGYVQHYADMGVKYLRVDFLSWYESGWDRYLGTTGPVRTLANYQKALQWMREACDANGMFLSLVMPNLYNEAVSEQKYGHMIRIDEDCAEGAWNRFSDNVRGVKRTGWSVYANPFDGYTYWSKIAGKGKMILDGDFIRLNTFANDEERKSVVSLHLLAGGPVSIADQYNTVGNSLWIYQNAELLVLNEDGFVGAPLTNDPTNVQSQIWKGRLSNGDWIVGFFNRETTTQSRSINFLTDLGISGNAYVRDLWNHSDLGAVSTLSKTVSSHACQVYRISTTTNKVQTPIFSVKGGTINGGCSLSISTLTTGATIYYTLDGTTPTTASALYTAPILITSTTVLKAIAVKSGLENSFVSSDTYTVNAVAPQSSMFIGGSFNNWNLAATPMTNTGGNNWISAAITLSNGNYQLKFANTSNWSGVDWGNANGLAGSCQVTTGGLPNIAFSINSAGNYTVAFNDAILNYSINSTLATPITSINSNVKVKYCPSEKQIKVSLQKTENYDAKLFDMQGKLLFHSNACNPNFAIAVNNFIEHSIVFLRIISNSSNYFEKILL